jgi:hypothetical protein
MQTRERVTNSFNALLIGNILMGIVNFGPMSSVLEWKRSQRELHYFYPPEIRLATERLLTKDVSRDQMVNDLSFRYAIPCGKGEWNGRMGQCASNVELVPV